MIEDDPRAGMPRKFTPEIVGFDHTLNNANAAEQRMIAEIVEIICKTNPSLEVCRRLSATIRDLDLKTPAERVSFAEENGIENASAMQQQGLICAIFKQLVIQSVSTTIRNRRQRQERRAHPMRRSNGEAMARRRKFSEAISRRIKEIAVSLHLSDKEIKPALTLKHFEIARFIEKYGVNAWWLFEGRGHIFKTDS
jgi:hypothetical protein